MSIPKLDRLEIALGLCLAVAARCSIAGDSPTMTLALLLAFVVWGLRERLERIESSLKARPSNGVAPPLRTRDPSIN